MEEKDSVKETKTRVGWIKFVRVVLWGVTLFFLPVGASLMRAGFGSEAVAKGADKVLLRWGGVFLIISLVLFVVNFVWGVARFAQKWHERKWKPFGGVLRTVWAGIWRVVIFSLVFLAMVIVVAPKIENGIIAKTVAERETQWLTGSVGVREDFRQGNISPDEYLRYMLAIGYGTEELPEKYRTDRAEMMPDILEILETYGESLSKETVEMAFDAIFLTNIEVGTDTSGNVARAEGNAVEDLLDRVLRTEVAQAYTKKATTLNKAVLSSKENFIIFYTDTGEDKITDAQAEELADMMERIVEKYKTELGLEYDYTFHSWGWWHWKLPEMTNEVLRNNGIEENKYETAMPVYVANPFSEETATLAFYSGEHLVEAGNRALMTVGKLFGMDMARWTKSAIGVPNITILSSNVGDPSLELVTAHELGHHYQNLYCQEKLGKQCPSGDFVVETGANWMAINVVDDQPEESVIQWHHNDYIEWGTCYRIDTVLSEPPETDACHGRGEFTGYPPVAFLQNYYENVSDSIEKLMDALLTDDSLRYLERQAVDEEWNGAMKQLSQRNLTNEYKMASLRTEKMPQGQNLECESNLVCKKEFTIRGTATKYFYFSTDEYDQTEVKVSGSEEFFEFSVLGKKPEAGWEVIKEETGELEYDITKEGDYDTIAFVVANVEPYGGRFFTVELAGQEVAEIADEAERGEAEEDDADGCMRMDFEEMWEQISLVGQSTFELLEVLGAETEEEVMEFEKNINEAKAETEGRKLVVCEIQMKAGVKMTEAEALVRKKLWLGVEAFEMGEAGSRVKLITGIDQRKRRGELFWLGEEDGRIYVLEMRVE